MKLSLMAAAAVTVFGMAATQALAQSLPVTGGVTAVTLTAAPVLGGAGLAVGGLGTAQISPGSDGIPLAYFPVTGGSLNTASFAGTIEHVGSGLSLSSATVVVNLTDFLINTTTGILSGQVAVGSTSLGSVPLFSLGASGVVTAPFSLTLTNDAGAALAAVFGIPNLAGAVIGNANTVPITSAVPEPSTLLTLLAGLGVLGAVARRRGAAGHVPSGAAA